MRSLVFFFFFFNQSCLKKTPTSLPRPYPTFVCMAMALPSLLTQDFSPGLPSPCALAGLWPLLPVDRHPPSHCPLSFLQCYIFFWTGSFPLVCKSGSSYSSIRHVWKKHTPLDFPCMLFSFASNNLLSKVFFLSPVPLCLLSLSFPHIRLSFQMLHHSIPFRGHCIAKSHNHNQFLSYLACWRHPAQLLISFFTDFTFFTGSRLLHSLSSFHMGSRRKLPSGTIAEPWSSVFEALSSLAAVPHMWILSSLMRRTSDAFWIHLHAGVAYLLFPVETYLLNCGLTCQPSAQQLHLDARWASYTWHDQHRALNCPMRCDPPTIKPNSIIGQPGWNLWVLVILLFTYTPSLY